MELCVSINSIDFNKKIYDILIENGVVIVEDVYTFVESDLKKQEIIESFEKIFIVNKKNMFNNESKLIPQSKPGLFQSLVSNIKTAWDIRQDERIINIFKYLYSQMYGIEIDNLIVSGDGINLCPPLKNTFENTLDWTHIDQTDLNRHCIQGQIVLSDSNGCFICTPRSHKLMKYMIEKYNKYSTDLINGGQWWKFSNSEIEEIKSLLEKPELYQIPIIAKKGSMILWLSHTIHSARPPIYSAKQSINSDWRTIIYICYRPDFDYTEHELKLRQEAFTKNYTTNHWGFYHYNQNKFTSNNKYIQSLLKNPSKVYDKIGYPKLNKIGKKLLGFTIN